MATGKADLGASLLELREAAGELASLAQKQATAAARGDGETVLSLADAIAPVAERFLMLRGAAVLDAGAGQPAAAAGLFLQALAALEEASVSTIEASEALKSRGEHLRGQSRELAEARNLARGLQVNILEGGGLLNLQG